MASVEVKRPRGASRVRVRRRSMESDLAMLARSMAISLALGSLAFCRVKRYEYGVLCWGVGRKGEKGGM